MQKTLGGDRLGAGKKMKVELHNYERSTHDLGYLWRSTMSSGTLVPFMTQVGLPGDTFDIHLNCDVKTHPTIGPLFGSYKVQLDVFMCPVRLYQAQLHNNKLGIGMHMADIKLPVMRITAPNHGVDDPPDINTSQINPSCILAYLGLRGIGIAEENDIQRDFNAIPLLAYWDIYKQYYSNKQELIGAVIHTPAVAITNTPTVVRTRRTSLDAEILLPNQPAQGDGSNELFGPGGKIEMDFVGPLSPRTDQVMLNLSDGRRISVASIQRGAATVGPAGTLNVNYESNNGLITVISWQIIQVWEMQQQQPRVREFPLDHIDEMRDSILQEPPPGPFVINGMGVEPYDLLFSNVSGYQAKTSSQEGLGLKTYQSDLFNNWLQTEWIDGTNGISEVTAIDTSGGSFTIDSLVLGKKVYDMLNRIAVSGGTYEDWLDAVYTHQGFTRVESPIYLGGLIKELVFQEVISNSATEGEETSQPLGTLAGRGVMSQKHKGGTIIAKVDEPCYIMGIISLTPRIDYSQGNNWDMHLLTMDDFHKPALDEIGFQELITEQMAWWTTEWQAAWITKSAGKQPAWINYMTNVNKTYGNFAIEGNEMFMTLNRRYEHVSLPEILDLTTYIDPVKFNQIFAQTSLDAQNFWTQISVDITARRKMSAKIMPNL